MSAASFLSYHLKTLFISLPGKWAINMEVDTCLCKIRRRLQFHEGPSFTFTRPLKKFSFLFPISSSSHGSSPYSSVMATSAQCEFTYLVPQCCRLQAHDSISIFTMRLFHLHHTVQAATFKKGVGSVHPSQPAELLPWAQVDTQKPRTLHTSPVSILFSHQS